jgi:tetratricopeptide (TPR) repeat protein
MVMFRSWTIGILPAFDAESAERQPKLHRHQFGLPKMCGRGHSIVTRRFLAACALAMALSLPPLAGACAGPREEAAALFHRGVEFYDRGDFAQAAAFFEQALRADERTLPPGDSHIGMVLGALGTAYSSQGRYAEAESVLKRSIAITEKALGADHTGVAASLNALATLYMLQSRHAEAEPLYKQSLAIREKAVGPDHPYVAESLNNLASLYMAQGR